MAEYLASVQNDDDDEEDEGEFEPGMDDDDDDDDEDVLAYDDEQDEDDSSRLRGSLEQTDKQLRYHGEVISKEGGKFDFKSRSDEPLSWSLLDDPSCNGSKSRVATMKGNMGLNASVEITMRFELIEIEMVSNGDAKPPPSLKSTGLDDDEDDCKKPAASNGDAKKPAATESRKAPPPPPPIYSLIGKGPDFGFVGQVDLSKLEQSKENLAAVPVDCLLQLPTQAAASPVAKSSATAAKPVSDADDEAAVGKVHLDELMALQQEAGFSVSSSALGKRSRRRAATNHNNKKRAPAEDDDDDDDDDIGF
eukprot:CAMPEP_0194034164 /NCGR_PEP_ID=MMETSP0009_2-20130614/6571_1 /TAXON_ID=210454 /ORGANISM="Grammatophora oceanica, Strain CCMP 410" /LENGTH=306 /DNA_ID=CAMNT_0038674959 /DNA_START=21 /DNA_END=941 /DNA_ORIENTATION=+